MDYPLISIIIPVYNVSNYLRQCLDSVIMQTYQNLEIVLVDDGSTDDSGIICNEYRSIDNRIKVIQKDNGGLSDARNKGLDIIAGEYITFVDSDDAVELDYVEYLYKLLKKFDADIAIIQCKKVFSFEEKICNKKEEIQIFYAEEAIENYLYQRFFTASAFCKIYKKNIFMDIRYPIGYYYEDMAIICKLLERSSKIVVSNQAKYYYLQRSSSIMNSAFIGKKMQRIEIAEKIRNEIELNKHNLIKAANSRCFLAAIQTFREIPMGKIHAIYMKTCWNQIKNYRKDVLFNPKAKKSIRFMALCSYAGCYFLWLLGRIYTHIVLH